MTLPISESLIITLAGLGVGVIGAILWYGKSCLLTSRCEEVSCCGLIKIRNHPLTSKELDIALKNEGPPPSLSGAVTQKETKEQPKRRISSTYMPVSEAKAVGLRPPRVESINV